MTTSHSAAGQSAPSCATSSYLQESELVMTEEEFKKDEGSFMIKTHVLPKNGGTGPADQGFGRIILVCSTKHKKYSKDKAMCFWHNQEDLMKFISGIRAVL